MQVFNFKLVMKFPILLAAAVAALGSSGVLGAACKPRPSASVSATESSVTVSETTITTALESLSTVAEESSSSTKEESISTVSTEAAYTTASTTESLPTTTETLSTIATLTTSAEFTTTLSTTSTVPEPEPTYITNERFDAFSDSYAPWAFAYAVNDASLSLTSTSVSAPNALKVTYTGSRANLVVGQPIDTSKLVAGVPYLATVWLRSNALSTAGSCTSMVIRASTGTWNYDRRIYSGELPLDTWVQLRTRITFTAAQVATNPSLYLSGASCGPGDYLFDDVTFGIAPAS